MASHVASLLASCVASCVASEAGICLLFPELAREGDCTSSLASRPVGLTERPEVQRDKLLDK